MDPEWGGVGASFMSTCLAIEALSNTDPSIALLADLQNTVRNKDNIHLIYI